MRASGPRMLAALLLVAHLGLNASHGDTGQLPTASMLQEDYFRFRDHGALNVKLRREGDC
jgi:hypothetical protein